MRLRGPLIENGMEARIKRARLVTLAQARGSTADPIFDLLVSRDSKGNVTLYRHQDYRQDPARPGSVEVLARENAELRAEVERLRSLALTDALTQLPNRRYMQDRLETEVARAVRYHQPLALLVIDVDDFKRINDTWGHKKGDEVLVWVASFLKSQLRACDVACRTGGDEFVVVLPGTTRDGAEQLAARLRELLSTLRRGTGQNDHPVKMSIGHAALGPGTGDVDSLVAAADHAMYEAKAAAKRGPTPSRTAQRSA